MMGAKKVYIIGGGPLGLGIAHEFLQQKVSVEILEAGPALLGLAGTFKHESLPVEKYYHFFYKNDHHLALDWLRNYSGGCEPNIAWCDITTDSVVSGRRYNLDSVFTLLQLSGVNVLRAGLTFVDLILRRPSIELDSIDAESWAFNVFGSRFAESVWVPLLRQKFGSRSKEVSAYWLATRIKRHLSTKGSGFGRSRFGYLVDTYEPYVDQFLASLEKKGGQVTFCDPVIELKFDDTRLTKINTKNRQLNVEDQIVFSSIPLSNLKLLMPHPNPVPLLNKFTNVGVIVCVLFLDKALSPHYWTTVSDERYPFSAIIQQNRLFPKSEEEIVYLSRYCEDSDPLMTKSETEIIAEWVDLLSDIYSDFSFKNFKNGKLFRTKNAAPLPYLGINRDLESLVSPFSNFRFSGYEMILPEDRGVGNSIGIGRSLARAYLNSNL